MIERFVASSAVIGLLAVPPLSSHHVVDIGVDELITSVTAVQDLRQWENSGYFVLRPEIFDHLAESEVSSKTRSPSWFPRDGCSPIPYKRY